MPTIQKLTARVKINAAQKDVFRAVTDWEAQGKWIFATKVKGVGESSHELGGKIEAFTGFGTCGFLDTMTITRWEPPHLCEVTHTGKVVKGTGLFEVVTINNETYFVWTEYTEVPFGFFGIIGWYITKPFASIGLHYSLKRFRKTFLQSHL